MRNLLTENFWTKRGCDFLFLLFSVCYLYVMQADLLALTQHVYSKGQTSYNPFWGTIILLIITFLLQKSTQRILKLKTEVYALSFVPSVLFLIFVTNLYPSLAWNIGMVLLILLFLFLFIVRFVVRGRIFQNLERLTFVRLFSSNVGILIILCVFCGILGNTNDVLHYELKIQRCLLDGKSDDALAIADRSLESSRMMSALRAHALFLNGELADLLFIYPQKDASSGLLLPASDSVRMLYPPLNMTNSFDTIPFSNGESVEDYLCRSLKADTCRQDSMAVRDYWLMSLLLDKKLDRFIVEFPKFYEHSELQNVDGLPRYYREALILYRHLRFHPKWVFNDNVTNTNYTDFINNTRKQPKGIVRRNYAHRYYGDTYWFYYYYG